MKILPGWSLQSIGEDGQLNAQLQHEIVLMYRVEENYVKKRKTKDLKREHEEAECCGEEIKCELK